MVKPLKRKSWKCLKKIKTGARQWTKQIAIGHLGDSGDLKIGTLYLQIYTNVCGMSWKSQTFWHNKTKIIKRQVQTLHHFKSVKQNRNSSEIERASTISCHSNPNDNYLIFYAILFPAASHCWNNQPTVCCSSQWKPSWLLQKGTKKINEGLINM